MRRHFLLLAVILLFTGVLYSEQNIIKLAVGNFDDSTTSAGEKEKAGNGIAVSLEKRFSSIDCFCVRTRGAIKNYLDKISLVESGLRKPDILKSQSGARKIDYLTVGTVSKINGRYEADARTVNVDNWQIVHSHGLNAASVREATDEIGWYISEKFTPDSLNKREKYNGDRPVVTVLSFRDFNREAMNRGMSAIFSEILNSQLGSFNNIVTVERKYSKSLIEEKILEMAGVTENDSSNTNLSIKKIGYKLTGDFRVFKDLICINYNVFNTNDGRLVFSGSREMTHPSQMRSIAWSIANIAEEVLANRIGTLKINTVPSNAEVFIDNVPSGRSPVTLSLAKGEHSVKLKMSGYQTEFRNLSILPRVLKKINIKLSTIRMQLLQKAYVYESRSQWKMAIKAYDDFIRKYNDTSEVNSAYYRKGHILMIQLRDYKSALETFKTLIQRYPDTMTRAEAYYGMAKAYHLMGMKSDAIKTKNYLLNKYGDTYAAQEAGKQEW